MTEIKLLKLRGKEFSPITLTEAVVVNTENISIPGLLTEITTLDKVLRLLGVDFGLFLEMLADKLDALEAGPGIIIKDGVISTNNNFTLYKVVTTLDFRALTPSKDLMNTIYLVPSEDTGANNVFTECICVEKTTKVGLETQTTYLWEKLGEVKTETDLSGYVTTATFNSFLNSAVIAEDVMTSSNKLVVVTYNIPSNLYDDMVGTNDNDSIEISE